MTETERRMTETEQEQLDALRVRVVLEQDIPPGTKVTRCPPLHPRGVGTIHQHPAVSDLCGYVVVEWPHSTAFAGTGEVIHVQCLEVVGLPEQ